MKTYKVHFDLNAQPFCRISKKMVAIKLSIQVLLAQVKRKMKVCLMLNVSFLISKLITLIKPHSLSNLHSQIHPLILEANNDY
jgi:hypothetical protein